MPTQAFTKDKNLLSTTTMTKHKILLCPTTVNKDKLSYVYKSCYQGQGSPLPIMIANKSKLPACLQWQLPNRSTAHCILSQCFVQSYTKYLRSLQSYATNSWLRKWHYFTMRLGFMSFQLLQRLSSCMLKFVFANWYDCMYPGLGGSWTVIKDIRRVLAKITSACCMNNIWKQSFKISMFNISNHGCHICTFTHYEWFSTLRDWACTPLNTASPCTFLIEYDGCIRMASIKSILSAQHWCNTKIRHLSWVTPRACSIRNVGAQNRGSKQNSGTWMRE